MLVYEDVVECLQDVIHDGKIKLGDAHVRVELFLSLFSDATKMTYSELMTIEQTREYGYASYIDEWRKQGLIE